MSDGRRVVVGGARVVSGAEKKKNWIEAAPGWRPRSNAKYDCSGGESDEALPPQPKTESSEGAAPPSYNRKCFEKIGKNQGVD